MSDDKIPVFLISDEKYAPYMCVTIASILENTRRGIHIVVLDGGINDDTKDKISIFSKKYAHLSCIEFLPVDIERFKDFPNLMHFSLNTYFRYLIPELKPGVDKALYIDCDMLLTADVGELYDADLCGKPLAAVPYRDERDDMRALVSARSEPSIKQILGLPDEHLYFNAGLLVIDCKQFRMKGWVDELFALTSKYSSIIRYPDQDILNIISVLNYHVLEDDWNAVVDIDLAYGIKRDEIPKVIHFTGGTNTRPWFSLTCPYRELFDSYARLTPFYDELFKQRVESELMEQKKIISQLVQAEYQRRRGFLYRVWMRLTGRRALNRECYSKWRKILSLLGCK